MRFIIVRSCSGCPRMGSQGRLMVRHYCKTTGKDISNFWDVNEDCPLLTEGELYGIMEARYEKDGDSPAGN